MCLVILLPSRQLLSAASPGCPEEEENAATSVIRQPDLFTVKRRQGEVWRYVSDIDRGMRFGRRHRRWPPSEGAHGPRLERSTYSVEPHRDEISFDHDRSNALSPGESLNSRPLLGMEGEVDLIILSAGLVELLFERVGVATFGMGVDGKRTCQYWSLTLRCPTTTNYPPSGPLGSTWAVITIIARRTPAQASDQQLSRVADTSRAGLGSCK